jgi:NAD(P)-dependent dehydrogenase (short-subunit alcohol dehydrogenase family)
MSPAGDRPVVVVTGGGGGIGAAVAEELGRRGDHVVTVDPLVTLDGSATLPAPEETTAGRIVAAGGSAQASSASVTDADAVRALFEELVRERGRLDAVVNVAGISRPTSFAAGTEEDWRSVLEVHLDGYRNVLEAALPIMAAAGRGRILGVTSGSGWRPADAGAYSCAKRAVAALTWQLGRVAPPGVVVNAMSPIAVTRMVTEALERARAADPGSGSTTAASGGLSLGSMPEPEDIGPFGAHLVGEGFSWCSGRVFFAGGSEVAVVEPPRLLEVVRTDTARSLPHLLETVVPGTFAAAEAAQASGGGANPRFGAAFEALRGELAGGAGSCAVVTDCPDLAAAVPAALAARGATAHVLDPTGARTFDAARDVLAAAAGAGPLDAVVVAVLGRPAVGSRGGWEQVLAEHAGIVDDLHTDAAWAKAATELAARAERPLRLVTLTDATARPSAGRSRGQAAAQLARASRRATDDRVAAFAVSLEAGSSAAMAAGAELVAHLVCHPEAPALAGGELAAGDGWLGLRAHPRPISSINLGGPGLPSWFDAALWGTL